MDEQILYRPRKRSKKETPLTGEQVSMLWKEYRIKLTTNNSEAEALKLLRGGKFIPEHDEIFFMGNDSTKNLPNIDGTKKLVREIRNNKLIYQN